MQIKITCNGCHEIIKTLSSKKQHCEECKKSRALTLKEEDPNRADNIKNANLKLKYGITIVHFNQMLYDQNNKCKICEREFKDSLDTHLDHDHVTLKNRAILCRGCNTGIGAFGEDIMRLSSAILYLAKHQGLLEEMDNNANN